VDWTDLCGAEDEEYFKRIEKSRLSAAEGAMVVKHLAILVTAALFWSMPPVHAADGTNPPTDLSAVKKKKGKGAGEKYLTIKMQDAMVTSYRPSQGGRPKGPPGGGLLDYTGGSLNPNAPAPTGTPLPSPAGPVIP
jgi:hypothetical protein